MQNNVARTVMVVVVVGTVEMDHTQQSAVEPIQIGLATALESTIAVTTHFWPTLVAAKF